MITNILLALIVAILAVGVYGLFQARAEQRDAVQTLDASIALWGFEVHARLEHLTDLETQKQAQREARPGTDAARERMRARAAQAKAG
jgi:hypothetical protein